MKFRWLVNGMTESKRIFYNIVATYGRSVYTLLLGIFCGRWTYLALGEVDYGLGGVVGGLTSFVFFINSILSAGIGRFYAVSVGCERQDPVAGLEKCREWFTTAVLLHSSVPLVLMVIGYPIGEWAVRSFLTIPSDRVGDCVWVWRFTCFSTFVSMITVPYNAMYRAKQEIAELTVYTFISATLNVVYMYYAVTHPGRWLVRNAAWAAFLSVSVSLIIMVRALRKYPECRMRVAYFRCWDRLKEMFIYSGWVTLGVVSWIARTQGVSVLINKYCGPAANAAMSVGNTVAGHSTTLSGSMVGAFSPAIMNAYGAGDYERARKLSLTVCRISPLLMLIFAIPLSLEVDEVLTLWLKNPPQYASGLCISVLAMIVIDKVTEGHGILIAAKGKMAAYQIFASGAVVLTLPLAWLLLHLGCNVYAVGFSIVTMAMIATFARVLVAKRIVQLSIRRWICQVAVPVSSMLILTIGFGLLPVMFCPPSFLRVLVTTAVVELVMLVVGWYFVLDKNEQSIIIARVSKFHRK